MSGSQGQAAVAETSVVALHVLQGAYYTLGVVYMVVRIRRLVREDAIRNKKENR
ncbi:hypothetical protein [Granulimonas faecalis]|uniref:hypothetical protein n=1 Tax=Granulimonas faecalis TaxID=2894155 RepID=UPI002240ED53|nr:hypothetical protein [Granulimonas faecalis]